MGVWGKQSVGKTLKMREKGEGGHRVFVVVCVGDDFRSEIQLKN